MGLFFSLMLSKLLTLSFLTLCLLFSGCSSSFTAIPQTHAETQQTAENKQLLDVKLVIESVSYEASLYDDDTALTLLTTVAERENIPLEIKGEGTQAFIQAIGEKQGGVNNKYWLYYINGEFANVGVGQYILHNGDTIEFRYE